MADSKLLLEIPSELITDRLHLRAPRAGDGASIYETARASLPELKRWMPWATDEYSATDAELWCRRVMARLVMRQEFPFLIFLRNGPHVGNISLMNVDWEVPRVEIGYWLSSHLNGRGYMSEAVGAISQFARTHLSVVKLEIRTDAENTKSRRVAERCGFQLEGTLRAKERRPSGELRDECIYGRIYSD